MQCPALPRCTHDPKRRGVPRVGRWSHVALSLSRSEWGGSGHGNAPDAASCTRVTRRIVFVARSLKARVGAAVRSRELHGLRHVSVHLLLRRAHGHGEHLDGLARAVRGRSLGGHHGRHGHLHAVVHGHRDRHHAGHRERCKEGTHASEDGRRQLRGLYEGVPRTALGAVLPREDDLAVVVDGGLGQGGHGLCGGLAVQLHVDRADGGDRLARQAVSVPGRAHLPLVALPGTHGVDGAHLRLRAVGQGEQGAARVHMNDGHRAVRVVDGLHHRRRVVGDRARVQQMHDPTCSTHPLRGGEGRFCGAADDLAGTALSLELVLVVLLKGRQQVLPPVVAVAVDHNLAQGVRARVAAHLLLVLLGAHVAADVGPRQVAGPPEGAGGLLAPAGLAPARRVLEHQRDERTQLRLEREGEEGSHLGHLLDGGGDAVHDDGRQFVQRGVVLGLRGRLLGQGRLQLPNQHPATGAHHRLQRVCPKHLREKGTRVGEEAPALILGFAGSHRQHDRLLPHSRRVLVDRPEMPNPGDRPEEPCLLALADGRVGLEGVRSLAFLARRNGRRRSNADRSCRARGTLTRGGKLCGHVVRDGGRGEEVRVIERALGARWGIAQVVRRHHGVAHHRHVQRGVHVRRRVHPGGRPRLAHGSA
ncbi:unnamed protein product, partial [Ixodes persulcatus]